MSGLGDGHVHLWRNGERLRDVIHQPAAAPGADNNDDGVTSVLAVNADPRVAFATAGRGALRLWTAEADPVVAVASPLPGAADPASLVQVRYGLVPPDTAAAAATTTTTTPTTTAGPTL